MNWALILGSVAGVLGLAALAWMLKLGGGGISSGEEAARIAEESLGGFEAERAFVSADGAAALVFGRGGDVALLKAHGVHVAARRLVPPISMAIEGERVRIDSGERMFAAVTLVMSPEDRDKLLTMV